MEKQIRDHYNIRINLSKEANGQLHAQIWRSENATERAALQCEIEANTRRIREAEYLKRYFIAFPEEFHETLNPAPTQRPLVKSE